MRGKQAGPDSLFSLLLQNKENHCVATHNHYPKSAVKLDTPFPTHQKPPHNTTAGPGSSCDEGRDTKYHQYKGQQGPLLRVTRFVPSLL